MTELPIVTQADRDAARKVWDGNLLKGSQCPDWLTEAFATHRIASNTEAATLIAELVDALRKIVELDVPRPVAVQYMPDRPSKHDKCTHDVWMYDECGYCISDFAAATLAKATQ